MEAVRKGLHEQNILELLENIHQGYAPTQNEQTQLVQQQKLVLSGTKVSMLEQGARYLTGLSELTLDCTLGESPEKIV